MAVTFRNYVQEERFGADYQNVITFLRGLNEKKVAHPNFQWGRWAWFISRPLDDEEQKAKIGLWADGERIVALATFELRPGDVYVTLDPEYGFLRSEILLYAKTHLTHRGGLRIIINDNDESMKAVAAEMGFIPTESRQHVARKAISGKMGYALPAGFSVTSMAEGWDYARYNRVMWRGFGSKGEPDQSASMIQWRKTMLSSPHLTPRYTIAVVTPDGDYASHCGLWHQPGEHYAYVEPLATDPDFRGMGLGKAAVYEALRRAAALGAREAYVISSQQFYYNIGFVPHCTETWWTLRPQGEGV